MREIRTSGLMSGERKRSDAHRAQATAPLLDSTPRRRQPPTGPQGPTLPGRPDQYGHGVTIPVTMARRVELAMDLMGDPEEFAFLNSLLAQCFLPCRHTLR